jgi:hypothetical protein
MENNNLKLTFFQQCEVNGVSKKGCSDGIKIGNKYPYQLPLKNQPTLFNRHRQLFIQASID